MNARQRVILLLAALLPLGCQLEPTAPNQPTSFAPQACGECPPLPAPGAAFFKLGVPNFIANSDTFEIAALVSPAENVTFTQLTVDYRSDCLLFLGATPGAVVPGASLFVNEGAATPSFPVFDPNSDRHVLVSASGNYPAGCGREVVILRFRVVAPAPALCWLRWDQNSPSGNPPNHLVTATPAQVRPENIQFCDQIISYGRGGGCDCPPVPPVGGADFGIGEPTFTSPDTFEVGLLVNAAQNIVFSQFTVDYRSDRLEFLAAVRGTGVVAGAAPFVNDDVGTPSFPIRSGDSDRHVLVNLSAPYASGCHIEVARLRFRLVAARPASCWLHWDDSSPAGNPPCHLVTDEPAQIRPETIGFCERELHFDAPTPSDFVLIGMEDEGQCSGVDALAWYPDMITGLGKIVGGLADGFRNTEAMTTRIVPGEPTRVFAVDDSRLLAIDPATGVGTEIGPIGFSDVDGIAFHPQTGVLYGVTNGGNQLISIDVTTGQGTLVLSHVCAGHRLQDIAFHPLTSDCYVLAGENPRLVKLDIATGAETTWVLTGATSLESLVWSRDGATLYSAADRGDYKDLVTLDLTAKTVSFVNAAPSGLKDVEALAWIERDRLPAKALELAGKPR